MIPRRVREVPPATPRKREHRLPPDIVDVLMDLITQSGRWIKIAVDQEKQWRMHDKRARINQHLMRHRIGGFEFTVSRGVLWGRYVPSEGF